MTKSELIHRIAQKQSQLVGHSFPTLSGFGAIEAFSHGTARWRSRGVPNADDRSCPKRAGTQVPPSRRRPESTFRKRALRAAGDSGGRPGDRRGASDEEAPEIQSRRIRACPWQIAAPAPTRGSTCSMTWELRAPGIRPDRYTGHFDRVAKSLPGLEQRRSRGGDGDGFADLRVAGRACRAVPDGEIPEARDGDRVVPGEGVGDNREQGALLQSPAGW